MSKSSRVDQNGVNHSRGTSIASGSQPGQPSVEVNRKTEKHLRRPRNQGIAKLNESMADMNDQLLAQQDVIRDLVRENSSIATTVVEASSTTTETKEEVPVKEEPVYSWEEYREECRIDYKRCQFDVMKYMDMCNQMMRSRVPKIAQKPGWVHKALEIQKDVLYEYKLVARADELMYATHSRIYHQNRFFTASAAAVGALSFAATSAPYFSAALLFHKLGLRRFREIALAAGASILIVSGSIYLWYRKDIHDPRNKLAKWWIPFLNMSMLPRKSAIKSVQLSDITSDCGRDVVRVPTCHHTFIKKADARPCMPKQYKVGFTIAGNYIWVPTSCVHQEENAIKNRLVLARVGKPKTRAENWRLAQASWKKRLLEQPAQLPKMGEITKSQLMEWLSGKTYSAGYKKMLSELWDKLDLGMASCRTKFFVKVEMMLGKKATKHIARGISGKTDEYLLETVPEFVMWLDEVYRLGCFHDGRYIYTSGWTGVRIGAFVSRMEREGWKPCKGDFEKYDAHQETEQMTVEIEDYEEYFPKRVADSFAKQLITSGHTFGGITFKVVGKRCSGVGNTSFGNTTGTFKVHTRCCDVIKIEIWIIVALGDDSMLFHQELYFDVGAYCKVAKDMGHILDLEECTYDTLEYCSAVFVPVNSYTRLMCTKPARMLAKTFVPTKQFQGDKELALRKHVKGVAECLYKQYYWVPIVRVILKQLLAMEVEGTPYKDSNPYKFNVGDISEIDLDEESIAGYFSARYGFDVLSFETTLAEVDFTIMGRAYDCSEFTAMCLADGVYSSEEEMTRCV